MNHKFLGSWELESFEIENTEKELRPWGKNIRGLLIYDAAGHMSVSINKDVVASGNPDKDVLDSILFYAGTYSIHDNVINHQVTIASNPTRVGKAMIRYACLDGDSLVLKTPQESYGVATLVWRKI